jgi:hypothetical protein
LFLYHAAVAADGAGRDALARRWLNRALANPALPPLYAAKSRRMLEARR